MCKIVFNPLSSASTAFQSRPQLLPSPYSVLHVYARHSSSRHQLFPTEEISGVASGLPLFSRGGGNLKRLLLLHPRLSAKESLNFLLIFQTRVPQLLHMNTSSRITERPRCIFSLLQNDLGWKEPQSSSTPTSPLDSAVQGLIQSCLEFPQCRGNFTG